MAETVKTHPFGPLFRDLQVLNNRKGSQSETYATAKALLEMNTMGPLGGIMISAAALRHLAVHEEYRQVSEVPRQIMFGRLADNLQEYEGSPRDSASPLDARAAAESQAIFEALNAIGQDKKVDRDVVLRHVMDLIMYTTLAVPEIDRFSRIVLRIIEIAQSKLEYTTKDMYTSARNKATEQGFEAIQKILLGRLQP